MQRLKQVSIILLGALVILAVVFFYGRYLGNQAAVRKEQPAAVTSQLILDRITDQYFLVTKTVFMDSQAEIETPKNNDWTDLFVGNKITVKGLIRVDVGVDMKGLKPEDIVLDEGNKTVTISLPPAGVLDSSLFGEMDFDEEKAIMDKLKGLFKDTQNEDYNRALQLLIANAQDRVTADGRIFNEARTDSMRLVELIAGDLLKDYRVIVK